jgi:hypothetical protein
MGSLKVAVGEGDGDAALVDEDGFEFEFASIDDGKPGVLAKLFVRDLETQPLHIGPEQHLDRYRKILCQSRRDLHGLVLNPIDQQLARPGSTLELFPAFPARFERDPVNRPAPMLFFSLKIKPVLPLLMARQGGRSLWRDRLESFCRWQNLPQSR